VSFASQNAALPVALCEWWFRFTGPACTVIAFVLRKAAAAPRVAVR